MQLTIQKNIIIESAESNKFLADAYFLDTNKPLPLVVFCHGYKGFKEWGTWDLMGKYIAEQGFYFVKFNFSHNGTTLDNPMEFEDLESFGRNTYSQEQRDLETVIDFFKSKPKVDSSNICLIGHSRGGGAVLVQAYHNDNVTKVITLAGVSDFKKRFPQGNRFEKWKEDGVFYAINARTKQQMPHYFTFYTDFESNQRYFDIQYCTQHLKKPLLIIQGTEDMAVSLKEAELLHIWEKNSELFIIEGADHVFGSSHPWEKDELPIDFTAAINKMAVFLKQ